ncbi:hypothetical protein GC167_08240 [bacterium]|nr:hypothetical protein [bacterium]
MGVKSRGWTAVFAVVLIFSQRVNAQANVRDSAVAGVLISTGLALQWPVGGLSESYGFNFDLGLDVHYKTRSNWLIGAGGSFLFGDEVKRSAELFRLLETSNGQVLDLSGNYAGIKVFERGYTATVQVGKIFNRWGHNPNSGLAVIVGAGWMQHRTRIESSNALPQLSGDFLAGYDQLRMGPALRQYFGYFHAGNTRTLNFSVGLDLVQGFTENVRVWDYSTNQPMPERAFDFLVGLKFVWFLPVYSDSGGGDYYYQ